MHQHRLLTTITRLAAIGVGAVGVGIAALALPPAAIATTPTPYVHLRVTQARDSSGRTIASVWLDTNAVMGAVGSPLVYTQPWHTTCQADPRTPLPGGKTQLIYLPTVSSEGLTVHWQPVVRIPTIRAQQITLCGYVVTPYDGSTPYSVLARTTVSVAITPPRGNTPMPLNGGPWRSCTANRHLQVVRLLANRGLRNGCAQATTIANAWIGQWHYNWSQWFMWENIKIAYPTVAWTSSPIYALHRTLACKATATTSSAENSIGLKDEIVNCGLASFRFSPAL